MGEKGKVCCDVKIGPKFTFWAGIKDSRPSWNGLEVIPQRSNINHEQLFLCDLVAVPLQFSQMDTNGPKF